VPYLIAEETREEKFMKSTLKWTAVVVVALMVIVIGALLIIPNFLDANRYKSELEKYVLETTGRPLRLGGDVRLSLFPWAGVSFSDLRLGNTPAFTEKDFLTVKSFDVRVKLWPLLSKQVEMDRLMVSEPRLLLVTNKDGAVNWDFGAKPVQPKPPAPTPSTPETGLPIASLQIGELSIQNAQIVLIDHGKGSRQEISGLNAAVRDISFDRPVRLTLSGTLNQKPFSAEGRFGPVGKNPGQGSVPLELTADAFGQLRLKVKGSVENLLVAPRASTEVEVAEFSPRRLLAEIGQPLPPTADAKVLERLSFKAGVTADAKSAAISNGLLALDDSKLNFTANATEFSKPNLAFDLQLDQINLDRYLPPKSSAGTGGPSAGPAAQKTDYAPLRKLVLNGNAKIGKMTVSNAKVEDVNLKIMAKDGILSLDPFAMKLYQGTAAGKTAMNVKGETPVTEVQLNLDKVQINPLLKDLANKDFLEGTTQARIALSTRGDDPARIKQVLDGKGNLILNDGAIVGVDLAGMVRNVKAAFGGEAKSGAKPRTDFAELIVPFTIANGVFHTTETNMKSPLVRLQAAGKADLVKETLDFRVDPKVVGTIKGQGDEKQRAGLGVPVIVSGTFASPSFRPDVEGLAKDRLKEILGPSATGAAPVKEKASELIKGLVPRKQ
jgi:AsmA protein